MSDILAPKGEPLPGTRRLGLRIWDLVHPHSSFIALAFLPIGTPISLWLWLDLNSLWNETLDNKVDIVQLLTAALVGAVAVDVFLSFQLQRILRPRVHVGYLISDKSSTDGHQFLEDYQYTQNFASGEGIWVHIRITNVGTIDHAGLTVACEIPKDWGGSVITQTDWDSFEKYSYAEVSERTSIRTIPEFLRTYTYGDL